jgi:hypothetical protein
MNAERRYALNADAVAAKVIDGEAILINIVTGRYFSLEGAAAVAWVQLSAGGSLDATAAAIAERYAVDPATARADAAALVEQLVDADLVVASSANGDGELAAAAALSALGDAPAVPEPYVPVTLTTFDDMEDLLAFDPPLPAAELPDGPWSPA